MKKIKEIADVDVIYAEGKCIDFTGQEKWLHEGIIYTIDRTWTEKEGGSSIIVCAERKVIEIEQS